MTVATAVLSARGVSRHYQRGSETVTALSDIDLDLYAGELVVLVGPSGSGKTTLLNLICGWEQPGAGQVSWVAGDSATLIDRPWRDVSIVPQALGLLDDLTVSENITLPARFTERGNATRFESLVDSLQVRHFLDRRPRDTSLGEQQRAAIARAILLRPALLLADEPTAHQDATNAARILTVLHEAAGAGTCCLIATHSAEVMATADRVLRLRDGRFVD